MFRSIVVIAIVLAVFFAAERYRPQIKGRVGEAMLDALLRKELPHGECRVLYDVILPTGDGATTQIDHIVVSRGGIFVVEAKTYGGWIFGDAKSAKWTAVNFRRRDRFQNPLLQNYRHVTALSKCLGLPREWFKSVVAFSGEATFRTEMPPGVMHFADVAGFIRANSAIPVMDAGKVGEIGDAILAWQDSLSPGQKASHVENLKKAHGGR